MADTTINVLSICSGIGGFDLTIRAGLRGTRTICYVEREAHAAAVLATRMAEGHLDPAPIWSDLLSFDARQWRGVVDLVAGGIPCQPFSLAGKRGGNDDHRALWREVVRIARECEPAAVFLENVPGFLRHSEPLWAELRGLGFEWAPPYLATASHFGAPHIRERVFLLAAHPERVALWDESRWSGGASGAGASEPGRADHVASDTERQRLEERRREPGDAGQERATVERGDRVDADSGSIGCDARIADLQARQPDHDRNDRVDADATSEPEQGQRPRQHREGRRSGSERDHLLDADANILRREVERCGWVFDRERQAFRHDAHGLRGRCRIDGTTWSDQSPIVRVGDGAPGRLDELHAIGNGVVPVVAAHALRELVNHFRRRP